MEKCVDECVEECGKRKRKCEERTMDVIPYWERVRRVCEEHVWRLYGECVGGDDT